jgi:tol-pal system protein YbgF
MPRARLGAVLAPLVLTLAVVAQLALVPARAALFDDDEARKRIEALRGRVEQIDQRLGGLESTVKSQGLVDLLRDIEQIKNDIAKLRGQFEVVSYELDQAQKRQRDLYLDLDARLRKLETAASAGATGGASGSSASPGEAAPPASPLATAPSGSQDRTLAGAADLVVQQRAYDAALDQFKNGNYSAAAASFQNFARANPKSPLAPSALYWAGNAQYALKDFRSAIASQRQLIATYPDSSKIPDALLNIASCLTETGDNAGARRTLEQLVQKYPGTEAAGKARQRLAGR